MAYVNGNEDFMVAVTFGSGLPRVTAEDDGKILIVRGGKWVLDYPENASSDYTKISITSFGHNAGIKEYGETVTDVTLSWALNKSPKTLTFDGSTMLVTATSTALVGMSITKDDNKDWTLSATDERGATATKKTALTFANGIYYGVAAEPTEYNSAFILGLTKVLKNSIVSAFTADAGNSQYIYYALPTRLGKCSFTTNGADKFELAATIDFTNAFGYTEDYYVYKSVEATLGYKVVTVSAYRPPSTGGGTSGGSGGTVTSGDTTYYGAVAEPAAYNTAFFNSLTKVQKNGKVTSFTVDAENGEYIYYALPTRLGMCQFTLGSFTGGFELADIVKIDNGNGDTEDYYVYKSDYDGLGNTTLSVS